MIIITKLPFHFFNKHRKGITIRPFIFIQPSHDLKFITKMINHKMIHYRQQEEMGLWKFLYQYIKEYLQNRKAGLNHYTAIKNISFEMEAYSHENDPDYLYWKGTKAKS